jgi:hypothetical protein
MPKPNAADLAERGDWAGCLSALLAQWRETRAPALAELIERVSPRAAGPPVVGGGSNTANVKKRIAKATDTDVPPIIELALVVDYTFPGDPEGEAVRVKDGHVTFVHHGAKIDLAYAVRVLPLVPRIASVALVASPKARIDEPSWAAVRKLLAKHHVELARPTARPG